MGRTTKRPLLSRTFPQSDFLSLHALFSPESVEGVLVCPSTMPRLTFEGAVKLVLHDCRLDDFGAMDTFIFVSSRHVSWNTLLALLESGLKSQDARVQKAHALFLYRWLTLSVIPSEASDGIAALLHSVVPTCSVVELLLSASRTSSVLLVDSPRAVQDSESQIEPSSITSILALPARIFAQQLTAREEKLFEHLSASDLLSGKPSEAGLELSYWSRRFPLWIATQLLIVPNASERANILVHFIRVAAVLLEMRNVATFELVMEGLKHPAIQRLSIIWDEALSKLGSLWAELEKAYSELNLRRPRRQPCMVATHMHLRRVAAAAISTVSDVDSESAHGAGDADWGLEGKVYLAALPLFELRRMRWYRYEVTPHAATQEFLKRPLVALNDAQLGILSRFLQGESQTLSDAVRSAGGIFAGVSSWLRSSPSGPQEDAQKSLTDALMLSGADWSEIFVDADVLKIVQKEQVLAKDELNTHLWRVKRGAISLLSDDGFIIGTIGDNQTFGELTTIHPLGLRSPVAMIGVAPSTELTRIPFVEVAKVFKNNVPLRMRYYESLCLALSNRGINHDCDNAALLAQRNRRMSIHQKLNYRFEIKLDESDQVQKFHCSWLEYPWLRVSAKLYVTSKYVALFAHAWSSSFRWICLRSKVVSCEPCGAAAVSLCGIGSAGLHEQRFMLDVREKASDVVKLLRHDDSAPASEEGVPVYDNRSWDYLVSCGVRSLTVAKDQVVVRSGECPDCIFFVCSGQLLCQASGNVAIRSRSFGEVSFFSGKCFSEDVIASTESQLYVLPWRFLRELSVSRPDVCSNFYRHCSVNLASRILGQNNLVSAALCVMKDEVVEKYLRRA